MIMSNVLDHTFSTMIVLIGSVLLFLSAVSSVINNHVGTIPVQRERVEVRTFGGYLTYYLWIFGTILTSVGIFIVVNHYLP